jgi:pSer/pThr/pTyr-binding forkhead associated (FHA) protein
MMPATSSPGPSAPLAFLPSPAPSFSLFVLGDGVVSSRPLPTTGTITVGRASDATIQIKHPSISREHLLLRLSDTITVEDLGSSHGTVLEGHSLRPGEVLPLALGKRLQIGAVVLTVVRIDRP